MINPYESPRDAVDYVPVRWAWVQIVYDAALVASCFLLVMAFLPAVCLWLLWDKYWRWVEGKLDGVWVVWDLVKLPWATWGWYLGIRWLAYWANS